MKTINVILTVIGVAVVFSTYLMVSKIMHRSDPASTAPSPAASVLQAKPEPAPQVPAASHEQPAFQHPLTPTPPVKEAAKLRPVGDIKVVMYMTDW
ncbi:MAG: hypothetical protein ACLPN1_13445 [Dissulfurispiraceae bacterium]|jgi:hypothetical protein